MGKITGIVVPGEGETQWVPDDHMICEFEGGLPQNLKKRGRHFDMSESQFPRRYSGSYFHGEKQLSVVFCFNEIGWDDVPNAMDHPPWRYVMSYNPKTKEYAGPVDLREGMAVDGVH